MSSSSLHGHQAHTWYTTYMQAKTPITKNKIKWINKRPLEGIGNQWLPSHPSWDHLLFIPSVSRCTVIPVGKPHGNDNGYDSSYIFSRNGFELTKTCSKIKKNKKKIHLSLTKITWNISSSRPVVLFNLLPPNMEALQSWSHNYNLWNPPRVLPAKPKFWLTAKVLKENTFKIASERRRIQRATIGIIGGVSTSLTLLIKFCWQYFQV